MRTRLRSAQTGEGLIKRAICPIYLSEPLPKATAEAAADVSKGGRQRFGEGDGWVDRRVTHAADRVLIGSKTEFFVMNPTENNEKALHVRETNPTHAWPLTEALEDYENTCNADKKKFCGSSAWLCAVILFFIVGILAFKQRFGKLPIPAPETVQKPLNISPYLTLNIPKQPFRLADFKNDAVRDAFDTSEENFIESQTGREFSYRSHVLFEDRAKTVTAEHSTFSLPDDTKFIFKWLSEQSIRDITYQNFESHLLFNGKIFRLNDVVSSKYDIRWSDIDPVDKKLFFSDAHNNRYAVSF